MNDDLPSVPTVRHYMLLAITALAVIALALFQDRYAGWSLLPVVPGILSLVLFSALGPVFVLGLLSFIILVGEKLKGNPPGFSSPGSEFTDMVLAASCLVYVAAHWRLLSLVKQAVPGDPRGARRPARRRLEGRWVLPAEDATRTPQRVHVNELFVLVGQGVLFGVTGFLLSVRLRFETPPDSSGIRPAEWRLLLLAWTVLLVLMAGQAAFAGLRWMLATGDECLVYLQDQAWAATRGEQRRIDAWVTRARLNRQRKEG